MKFSCANSFAISILSYNHPDLTEKCVRSVLSRGYVGEIYLIHNGSLLKNETHLKNLFPQILHFSVPQNRGYSAGANFVLSTVFQKYETCLFLTNDTELIQLPKIIPHEFSSVQSYKRQTEKIDSIGGLIDIKHGRLVHRKNETDQYNIKDYIPYVPGTAFWMTKKIYESIGPIDETYHTYWEDVDFSYRAGLKKIPLSHSTDTIIRHKIGKTCHKDDFYTYYLFQRNRKRFMKKHNLTNFKFWILFYFDLLKNMKSRYSITWKIIND